MEELVLKCKALEQENILLKKEVLVLRHTVKTNVSTIGKLIEKFIVQKTC